jgi:isopenicillin-N N-acyltransferase like protein
MTTVFRSTAVEPRARGYEFGTAHAEKIRGTITTYQAMFDSLAGRRYDIMPAGRDALDATAAFAPALYEEMIGIAEGAALDPALIGAINARTEILASLNAPARGECSAVISLPPQLGVPVAVQTWDWYYTFTNGWLVWEIPLADGTVTKTMTEYGIVGKVGLNTRGLGLLFTILHHVNDGKRIGVPVHVAARWALDRGHNINRAAQLLASADVSASSSVNLVAYEGGLGSAISIELYPGGPGFVMAESNGLIVHTNHFLADGLGVHDTEPKGFPDTLLRRDLLRRRLSEKPVRSAGDIIDAMTSHVGGEGAVCCHHNPKAQAITQYETLATVVLDLSAGELAVYAGGPCSLAN